MSNAMDRMVRALLVVLLDQSDSMSIADRDGRHSAVTRAEAANAALQRARTAIERLEDLHELRLRGTGADHDVLSSWIITPGAPVSALAAAVREAGAMRSLHGSPPAAIVLVSDGADNVSPAHSAR